MMNKYQKLLAPLSQFNPPSPMHWVDLGCGSGVFTEVLANILQKNSRITAIDRTPQHIPNSLGNHVTINFQQLDFVLDNISIDNVDGILMANALHFVKDKTALIKKLERLFKASPTFLIVEYDHNLPNPWEPYPISLIQLKDFFTKLNYGKFKQLGEQQSAYGGMMYACLIQKN